MSYPGSSFMYTTTTFRSKHGGLPSRCDTWAVSLQPVCASQTRTLAASTQYRELNWYSISG